MTTLGFIGLGRMGRPIAKRLADAGNQIVTLARHAQIAFGDGWETRASPRDVAECASVIFTCLPSPEVSREVYLGDQGLLRGAAPGTVVVELSTLDPGTAMSLAAGCEARDVEFLDAPVSGGPKGAAAGTLTLMVGGKESTLSNVRALLGTFGGKCVHMGPAGAGSSAKLCNQMLTGVTHVLVAEAMVLGAKAGLDPQRLYEVLRASSGQSNSLERAVPNFILPRKFEAAFALDGIYKDLECVTRTGTQLGVRLLLSAVAQQAYEEARSMGAGHLDVAAVLLAVERASDIAVLSSASPPSAKTPV